MPAPSILRGASVLSLIAVALGCHRDVSTNDPPPASSSSTSSASLDAASAASAWPTAAPAAPKAVEPTVKAPPTNTPRTNTPTIAPIVVEHERVGTIGFVTEIDEGTVTGAFPGSTVTRTGQRYLVRRGSETVAEVQAGGLSARWVGISTPAVQTPAGLRVGASIPNIDDHGWSCQLPRADGFGRRGAVLCSQQQVWNVFYEVDAAGTKLDAVCAAQDCFVRDPAALAPLASRKITRILWKNAAGHDLH